MKFDLFLAVVLTVLNVISTAPARAVSAQLEEEAPPWQSPAPEPTPKGLAPSDWTSIHAAHAAWQQKKRD